MNKPYILILFTLTFLNGLRAQEDTVFIRQKIDWSDTLKYKTDTIIFRGEMDRNILIGTCVMPFTHNQLNAYGFGLELTKVSKSDCRRGGEEVYTSDDKINFITRTDTSMTVETTIYDNCCYDFLCDISVDSSGTLNLIYHGYGTYCACNCCFGLTFTFKRLDYTDYKEIKAIMINGNRKTIRKVIK